VNSESLYLKEQFLKKLSLSPSDKNQLYHNIIQILNSTTDQEQIAKYLVDAISQLYSNKLIDIDEQLENADITKRPPKDGKPRFWRVT
jgi:hypothetical protein